MVKMNSNIFKKFSENLKKVLITAERIAREQNTVMSTEHQLLALLNYSDTLAYEILSSFEVTLDRAQLVASLVNKAAVKNTKAEISSDAKESIKMAVSFASKYGHFAIDCEHLLLALLSNRNFSSYTVIERIGVKPDDIRKQIETIFGGINETLQSIDQNAEMSSVDFSADLMGESMMNEFGPFGPMGGMAGPNQSTTKIKSDNILSTFTTNITRLAQNDKLDPVIGRNSETTRLVQILSRRTKNNPVLVGEPGVGKTAIVEGLAQRIVEGRVPSNLIGKEILSIDMGSLLAGTMYRGQFEGRVKKILNEIKKNGNYILFIDEIHTVVGAGSTEGSVDAANLLKPMLGKGELRLIGSTTLDEYKKFVERDPAFERRFQQIMVKEPTIDETVAILCGIKDRYETHHNVTYTQDAIVAAAKLSKRYINDRFLPDKAIDLIDEAAAATRTVSPTTARLAVFKRDLRKLLRQKEHYILNERYEEATKLREKELEIENKIRQIKQEDKPENIIVSANDISRVVSRWTGIPVTELNLAEKRGLLDLESRIERHIVGQKEAVSEIAKAIRRARVGISNPNRPYGSFIFLGPTGVGKTELAKVLAEEVMGSRNALIKIDMSEFMERHNVSRLIGAPAGYVGYEEGGKLTEVVRKNPYSLILLDEIEKAHPEVFNILLQVMEDGELTDAKGRKVDFKNTILIMTSNLGTDILNKQASIGFTKRDDSKEQYEKLKENVLDVLKDSFRPEFLNRLDKVIVFHPLTKEAIKQIVEIQLAELARRLWEQGYYFEASLQAKNWIAENGFDPKFGARPIRKVIAEHIETPLSEAILREDFKAGNKIKVDLENNSLVLKKGRNLKA